MNAPAPVKISVRNLYKIFGPRPEAALADVRKGMGKTELLENGKHVLGLSDINIDMRAGQITVIMGLSGSGKSTLVRHLNRLIEPTAGQILIDGTDVTGLSPEGLRRLRQDQMTMVFQKFALLPHRTVLENAALALEVKGVPLAERSAEAMKWLERVGLGKFADSHPHRLSGGMQQRVGIARALASNAPILLMDEAFSALDPLIRTDMQNLLLQLQTELHKTIIFISHDLDEALKLADHLVILKDGCVVQQGDPQSIVLHPRDPYIVDFVSDINRARVLRVRSVMTPGLSDDMPPETVDTETTLEALIALSDGDTHRAYTVLNKGQPAGRIDMRDVVRALVPKVG
ncbi:MULTISPECIES: glycine betaine/L-proline ABC transporter ATP-binding protein [Gemmobacter]|jgi:glycine betaine/proline transport system ATP-binding protein|uniref:Proline/glycine betaine ABC transporter ATP-binding protein n=1 Tax=Gemmobacter nanjingensis TaxID=488454 RepID=A0ABQ3FDZ2_9RHOB|nr:MULTISPECIES: ATP-binding cassette domain-containing protein [Gemmobacter]OJY28271.1 MAG: glycine/betaine ABC transporter [Rhodobacterales bacterium 65-51]GHC19847.1 proline/glycine betaine ABC transporter ATP-binding protein [Gemmobacter nanjingensis]